MFTRVSQLTAKTSSKPSDIISGCGGRQGGPNPTLVCAQTSCACIEHQAEKGGFFWLYWFTRTYFIAHWCYQVEPKTHHLTKVGDGGSCFSGTLWSSTPFKDLGEYGGGRVFTTRTVQDQGAGIAWKRWSMLLGWGGGGLLTFHLSSLPSIHPLQSFHPTPPLHSTPSFFPSFLQPHLSSCSGHTCVRVVLFIF